MKKILFTFCVFGIIPSLHAQRDEICDRILEDAKKALRIVASGDGSENAKSNLQLKVQDLLSTRCGRDPYTTEFRRYQAEIEAKLIKGEKITSGGEGAPGNAGQILQEQKRKEEEELNRIRNLRFNTGTSDGNGGVPAGTRSSGGSNKTMVGDGYAELPFDDGYAGNSGSKAATRNSSGTNSKTGNNNGVAKSWPDYNDPVSDYDKPGGYIKGNRKLNLLQENANLRAMLTEISDPAKKQEMINRANEITLERLGEQDTARKIVNLMKGYKNSQAGGGGSQPSNRSNASNNVNYKTSHDFGIISRNNSHWHTTNNRHFVNANFKTPKKFDRVVKECNHEWAGYEPGYDPRYSDTCCDSISVQIEIKEQGPFNCVFKVIYTDGTSEKFTVKGTAK